MHGTSSPGPRVERGHDGFASVATLFRPRSVAVIGASADERKPGGRAYGYLTRYFSGTVMPVNPRAPGMAASVAALPGVPDVALVAVPAAAVADELAACAASGVRAAIVLSSGFAEVGPAGQALQDDLRQRIAGWGMRVLGPNCIGLFGAAAGFYATFTTVVGHGRAEVGPVSMVSQSGAVGAHVFSLARDSGIGFSYWAATGNQVDVDVADCIGFYASDPDTRVIAVCLEGCPDGDRLQRALAVARRAGKPVVALKLGRSEVGAEAAATHTGSLVGSDAAFDAVFERHGVLRVRGFEEMVDLVAACVGGVHPAGPRLGIASISGGAGILMADDAADAGLQVPALPPATQARLKALAPLGAARNPVDTTAGALVNPALLRAFLAALLESDEIDAAVLFVSNLGRTPELLEPFRHGLADVRSRHPGKPVALVIGAPEPALRALRDDGFLTYQDPLRAIRALAGLARYARARRRADPDPGAPDAVPVRWGGAGGEREALALLGAHGIPVVRTELARSAADAVAAAHRLGFPVVLKIASSDVAHKSDVGGVALGLADEDAVASAFASVTAAVARACPDARLDGVVVAPMVRGGTELILGARHDPIFGPMVMVGLGGVYVDVLRDVVLRVAPVDEAEALEMIGTLRGAPILRGARGHAPLDVGCVARSLVALSRLIAAAGGRIREIDVNPFVVLPDGGCAVDALIAG